jgi:hypothetical protein
MGTELKKLFFVFRDLVSPDRLAVIKRQSIALEEQLAASGRFPETRPLNLDPGLLNLGKLMLASTKDQAQRIYLGEGIYAEVTLWFKAGQWQTWPWTYADYRQECVHAFFLQAREYYRDRLAQLGAAEELPLRAIAGEDA